MNILINSKNRVQGTSSNFVIRANNYIDGLFKVKNISLTNAFYIVRTDVNDRFELAGNFFVVPEGSYNLGTLINAIQALINAVFGVGQYTLSVSGVTGRITFSGLGAFDLTFINALNYLLGFSNSSYSGQVSYVAENFTNITKLNLGIRIKEADQTNNVFNFANDGVSANLYFKTVSNFGDILTQTYDQIQQKISIPTRTNQLTISIIDLLTGLPIDLNNSDFELLLEKSTV